MTTEEAGAASEESPGAVDSDAEKADDKEKAEGEWSEDKDNDNAAAKEEEKASRRRYLDAIAVAPISDKQAKPEDAAAGSAVGEWGNNDDDDNGLARKKVGRRRRVSRPRTNLMLRQSRGARRTPATSRRPSKNREARPTARREGLAESRRIRRRIERRVRGLRLDANAGRPGTPRDAEQQ